MKNKFAKIITLIVALGLCLLFFSIYQETQMEQDYCIENGWDGTTMGGGFSLNVYCYKWILDDSGLGKKRILSGVIQLPNGG